MIIHLQLIIIFAKNDRHSKYGYSHDHMIFLVCFETPFKKIVSLNNIFGWYLLWEINRCQLAFYLYLYYTINLCFCCGHNSNLWSTWYLHSIDQGLHVFTVNYMVFTWYLHSIDQDLILRNIHLLRRNSNEMKPNFCLTKLSATPQNNPSSLNTYKAGPQTLIYKVGLIVEFLETWDVSLLKLNPCL